MRPSTACKAGIMKSVGASSRFRRRVIAAIETSSHSFRRRSRSSRRRLRQLAAPLA